MPPIIRVLGWATGGSLIAGVSAFAAFLVFNAREILGPKDADEVQAWARFSAIATSLGFAIGGFVCGAAFGAVRLRSPSSRGSQ